MCPAVNTYGIGSFDRNPRGDLWAKDESKFGQKLMSKMGWSRGKGLGKNEDGITDCIKARMKVGRSGVGCSGKLPISINGENYEAVLESLNNKYKTSVEPKTEDEIKGLEQRSHQFKNRLHYQKFVRGKDVRRYSEKDMNSIFVTKKTPVELPVNNVKSSVTNVDCDSSENSAPELRPTFNSRLSMNDYFAMKLKRKLRIKSEEIACYENQETQEKDSEIPQKIKTETPETSDGVDDKLNNDEKPPSNKKGKKNQKFKFEEENSEAITCSEKQEPPEKFSEMPVKKKTAPPETSKGVDNKLSNGENPSSNKKGKKKQKCKFEVKFSEATLSAENQEGPETDQSSLPNEVPSKKRKREQKYIFESSKKVKTEQSNISDSADVNLDIKKELNEGESALKNNKEKKNLKSKIGDKIENLKSCLKGKFTTNLWFAKQDKKEVSFNDSISYKIIENVLDEKERDADYMYDSVDELDIMDCFGEDIINAVEEDRSTELSDGESSNLVETGNEGNGLENCEGIRSDDIEEGEIVENDDVQQTCDASDTPKCFDLPKCNNSNYNAWLESQKIAIKMKLYKNMVKKIKKDKVLRTSNLLDIKGYGNWGL